MIGRNTKHGEKQNTEAGTTENVVLKDREISPVSPV